MNKKTIQSVARKKILYSHHATVQMNTENRLITTEEVRNIISRGIIIEERNDDKRGATIVLGGKTYKNRTIHVVCSPKENYLVIVTAYIPDKNIWDKTLTKRKGKI